MNWKPEVLSLGYHGRVLRWQYVSGATTISPTGIFVSYKGRILGISFDWKDWLIGVQFYSTIRDRSITIHFLPTLSIYIHWHKKEKPCATRAT
jgi:hypothetical protein